MPLGMTTSQCSYRTITKPGHEKDMTQHTLIRLYKQRPA